MRSGPSRVNENRCAVWAPPADASGGSAAQAPSRTPPPTAVRHEPRPGLVTISMPGCPPSWYSAAKRLVWIRIWRIWLLGGRRPPLKPFTRRTAPGPARRLTSFSISSGSSGREAISSGVRTCENDRSRASDSRVSSPTVTFSSRRARARRTARSPPASAAADGSASGSKPRASTRSAQEAASVTGKTTSPVVPVTARRGRASGHCRVTAALGTAAPLGSRTRTRNAAAASRPRSSTRQTFLRNLSAVSLGSLRV